MTYLKTADKVVADAQTPTWVMTSVEDGPNLLEVPRWDFHGQMGYQFPEPYPMRPQDNFIGECNFDNSFLVHRACRLSALVIPARLLVR